MFVVNSRVRTRRFALHRSWRSFRLAATAATPWGRSSACAAIMIALSLEGAFRVPVSSADGGIFSAVQIKSLGSCGSEENCVSSSAIGSPVKYGAPWSYATVTDSPREAWSALEAAVRAEPGVAVREVDGFYLHATAPSVFPPGGEDDIEFLLRPEEKLVLYRSRSQKVTYIYPFHQPLGDFGSNRKRLERIRDRLGWQTLDFFETQ